MVVGAFVIDWSISAGIHIDDISFMLYHEGEGGLLVPFGIQFYETAFEQSPVKDYILDASEDDRADIVHVIDMLEELGFELLGTKYMKKLRGDIFELRIKGERLHRILLFFQSADGFVLLHAFTKQTPKTPSNDIGTAEKRMRRWLKAHNPKNKGVR